MSRGVERQLLLHPGQMAVYRTRSRFKCIVAGRRWGKTWYARTEMVRRAGIPKSLVWYVAPTYRMAKDIMWGALLEAVPPRWIVKINETNMRIELRNRSVLMCKGADKPDSLRGVGLDHVILDEFQDMDREVWGKAIRPTLATTGGRATFIGTPKSFNHLYEVFTMGQRPDMRAANRWHSWQFQSIDSPFVPEEEVAEARQEMDEKSFRQEFEASFETMGGRVYYPFDRNLHVDDSIVFDPKCPIWVGQDFNRDPMASVILQPRPNGELWIVDEIYIHNASTQDAVDEVERRYWRHMKQTAIFPDPAGSYHQHARGETDLDIFRERGYNHIYHRRKHPKVSDRVNCVNRLLKAADGSVKLRINRKCERTIESLEQTIYKEGARDVDKSQGMEHPADALGYPIEYKFPMRKIIIAGTSL